MAKLSRTWLLARDPDTDELLDFIRFDSVPNQEAEATVLVTDFPVESGAVVSDHVLKNPDTFRLEGVVTNTPHVARVDLASGDRLTVNGQVSSVRLRLPAPFRVPESFFIPTPGFITRSGVALTEGRLNPPNLRASVLTFTPFDAVSQAWDKLYQWQANATLLDVQSRYQEIEGVIIERLSQPRNSQDGSSGTFLIECRQIRTVISALVDAPKPVERRGQGKQNKGNQGTGGNGGNGGNGGKGRLESMGYKLRDYLFLNDTINPFSTGDLPTSFGSGGTGAGG